MTSSAPTSWAFPETASVRWGRGLAVETAQLYRLSMCHVGGQITCFAVATVGDGAMAIVHEPLGGLKQLGLLLRGKEKRRLLEG